MEVKDYDWLWNIPRDLPLTGRGCCIGVIDQPAWLHHPEYHERLIEVIRINLANDTADMETISSMHGPAVLSIAVGTRFGVAPNASVVYCAIETWNGRERLLKNHALALQKLRHYVSVRDGQLDAISTSHAWKRGEAGADENDELVAWFEGRNIPVFSANDPIIYPCGPDGLADYWNQQSPRIRIQQHQVAIPVDERLIACRNREEINAYGDLYYRLKNGGYSWAVPLIAGLFILGREADRLFCRSEFERSLLSSARPYNSGRDGNLPVIDINKYIEASMLIRPGPRVYNPQQNGPR